MRRWLCTTALTLLILAGPLLRVANATCVGRCNDDGSASTAHLLAVIDIALGHAESSICEAGDANHNGRITVDEVIGALDTARTSCLPAGPVALFSADPLDPNNPFPSDRLLDATGHVRISAAYLDPGLPTTGEFDTARSYLQSVADQLRGLTGFGTYAPLRVRFDRPVLLPAAAAMLLLPYDDLTSAPVEVTVTFDATDDALEIQPIFPLQPKTRYALIVSTAVTDAAGHAVRPSPDFTAVLAGDSLSPELAAYRVLVQPVIDAARQHFGIGSNALALISVFTTQAITDDLLAIRDRFENGELTPGPPVFDNAPIPGLETGIFPEGSTQFQHLVGSRTSASLSTVAAGSFDSYDFRDGPEGAFAAGLVHGSGVPPVNHLDFYVTIPKAAAPPQGYPVVIFAHGLSGSGRDVIDSIPRTIGNAPLMGLAISALHNGRRGEPATFFTFDTIAATREYIRQSVADLLQLERMVRNAHDAGTPPFDQIDPDHVLYMGGSLGAIMGTLYMAIEPDVHVAMLSVPGGGLPIIIQSPTLVAFINPLLTQQSGVPEDSPFFPPFVHRMQQVLQWAWDPADPINYAAHVVRPGAQLPGVPIKHVLMHEGIVDTLVPKATTDALAAAMQLPDVRPTNGCNDIGGCNGIWRFVMTDYGQPEFFGHGVTTAVPQARMQAGQFLSSFGTIITDAHP